MLPRSSLRDLWYHRWQTALAVAGVALGVAVVVAVDLANQSAREALRLSNEAVAGQATHEIAGGPRGLPEDLYRSLRAELGLRQAAPVVEGTVRGPDGRSLRVLGVDPFAEAPFRPALSGEGLDADRLMTEPGTAVMTPATARELDVEPNEAVRVTVDGTARGLRVIGLLTPRDPVAERGLQGVLITDIATAQEVLDTVGRLSRIDLILPDDAAGDARHRAVEAALPDGVRLVPTEARGHAMEAITRAFHLNLTAFSLLALLVGAFLIYNTVSFSVVRRRELFARLRAIGVTRRQLFATVAGEALVLGAAGAVAGIVAGIALGHGLVGLVTRTIDDLYFVVTVRDMTLAPAALALGGGLGVLAALGAAMVPAWEAARIAPAAGLRRASLEVRVRRLAPWLAVAGAGLTLVSAGWLFAGTGGLVAGFAALFGLAAGCALMVPAATAGLMRGVQPAAAVVAGPMGRLAARGAEAALSRTGVAVAALMVAVAAVVSVGVMVDSFRQSVAVWLESSLRADVYVSAADAGGTDAGALGPALPAAFGDVPGVAAVTSVRRVILWDGERRTRLWAYDLHRDAFDGFRFRAGDRTAAWPRFRDGEAALVTEPFAAHRDVGVGDAVRLPTQRGDRAYPVAGVVQDYTTSEGAVLVSRAAYDRDFEDPTMDGLGIYLAAGADAGEVTAALRQRAPPEQALRFRPNRELRDASMAVFDRTFAITHVLRLLAVVVAVIGVFSALLALALERTRELAVMRAIGLTPVQVWGMVVGQSGLLGLAAGLLAVPAGLVMALGLIGVINERSFGWSMQMTVDPAILAGAVALAVGAALVAGLEPARRMGWGAPADGLRGE